MKLGATGVGLNVNVVANQCGSAAAQPIKDARADVGLLRSLARGIGNLFSGARS